MDARYVAQLMAFGAVAGDLIITQIYTHAVPVLEGMRDGHAALRPQAA